MMNILEKSVLRQFKLNKIFLIGRVTFGECEMWKLVSMEDCQKTLLKPQHHYKCILSIT